MTEEKKQLLHPISEVLCSVYNDLYQRGEVSFELQDGHIDKLDTVVKTVFGSYFGITRFPNPKEKAAVFFCLLIKDHPVLDGNKRLAVLWLQIVCEVYKLNLDPKVPLDELAVGVEQTKDMDNDKLFSTVMYLLF